MRKKIIVIFLLVATIFMYIKVIKTPHINANEITLRSVFEDDNTAIAVANQMSYGIDDALTNEVIGQVVSLDLNSQNLDNLNGIDVFYNLEVLDISNNDFMNIPKSLETLSRLKYLNVEYNCLPEDGENVLHEVLGTTQIQYGTQFKWHVASNQVKLMTLDPIEVFIQTRTHEHRLVSTILFDNDVMQTYINNGQIVQEGVVEGLLQFEDAGIFTLSCIQSFELVMPTLTYELNGFQSEPIESKKVSIHSWIEPTPLSNENQHFIGWFDQEGNAWSEAVQMPAHDVTLYARWTGIHILTVHIDTHEITYKVAYGQLLAQLVQENNGYEFEGYVDKDGNQIAADATMPDHDFDIYANFTEKIYNLTLYMNDGTDSIFRQFQIPYKQVYEMPLTPTRDGYVWIGYNTKADGSGTTYTHSYQMASQDTSLYAMWSVLTSHATSKDDEQAISQVDNIGQEVTYSNTVSNSQVQIQEIEETLEPEQEVNVESQNEQKEEPKLEARMLPTKVVKNKNYQIEIIAFASLAIILLACSVISGKKYKRNHNI